MGKPNKIETGQQQEPLFEPFPEPRTMPEGWDLSGFNSDKNGIFLTVTPKMDPESNIEH